ncbi:hypothetical protein [Shinella sp. BYT-45]|uniref:hypothetical protein n=1 Tax=Shinella sp. BYT-45 TaxID=3377377 RepID=UPI00397F9BEC
MTLLSALRATKVLGLAVVLAAGGMTAADARDGWHSRHHGHHSRFKKLPAFEQKGHGGRLRTELRYGSDRELRHGSRSFYGGAIAAYRGYGDGGTYFYVEDDSAIDWYDPPAGRRKGGPKVITVTPGGNGCSWEAGVCVIRPGR